MGNVGFRAATLTLIVLNVGLLSTSCTSPASHTSTLNVGCNPPVVLGAPSMPTPERLGTTLAFSFNHIRLYPPPARISPNISAVQAWDAVVRTRDPAHGLQLHATYELVLAEWNSIDPTVPGSNPNERLLVWLVIGRHIWVSTLLGGTNVSAPRCIYESAMWPVNATSGLLYGGMTFPPMAEVFH